MIYKENKKFRKMFIAADLVSLNITNITIMWHNLLHLQQHIQKFDGMWCPLLFSNVNRYLKLTWPDALKWLPWLLACADQFQK